MCPPLSRTWIHNTVGDPGIMPAYLRGTLSGSAPILPMSSTFVPVLELVYLPLRRDFYYSFFYMTQSLDDELCNNQL